MTMKVHQIQPLPQDVAAKIKSSTSITRLNGVIVELVKNALDANARSVFVTVDYRRGGCVVEDDGDGIIPAEFEAEGGLGKAHHTSKFHLSTAFSRKGCFLASLSSLALLTITSHHAQHPSTNTVMFHHSAPVARLTPAPKHHALRFSDHGTRITVNDLFGNMPVRVKSRALTLQKADELDRQWDDLKYLLVSLIVANDGLERLVLSDVSKERKLTIRPRRGASIDGLDLTRFSSIISQAGFESDTKKWHSVSAKIPHLTIRAALSLLPSPSKKVQFISLGTDPVFPQNQANVLYSEVNRLFSLSDFGTSESGLGGFGLDSDLDGRRSIAVNRWPMFYIRIDSDAGPISGEDLPESDKSLQRILDVLTVMINEFLKEHRLRPRGAKRQRHDSVRTESPARSEERIPKTSSVELSGQQIKLPSFSRPSASHHFGSWSRVKSASSQSNGVMKSSKPEEGSVDKTNRRESVTPVAVQQDQSYSAGLKNVEPSANAVSGGEKHGNGVIPWVDSHTGMRHWVNSRTGQTVIVRPSVASALASRPRTAGSLTRVLDTRKRPASAAPDSQKKWLENLLENWNNPVFGRSERPINALDTESEYDANVDAHHFHEQCELDSFGVSKYRGKLRKGDLATARVIRQVDRKFILVEMPSQDTSALVLIDQHAADERCRVERLSQDFFDSSNAVRMTKVDPVIVDIPAAEGSLFRRQAEFLRSWGIEYLVEQTRSSKASVSITGLPTLIAERCRTEPDQLISMIRAEIWKRAEGNARAQAPDNSDSGSWVERMAGCPRGILEMLNSRACRTAIMFNDVLSVDECGELVKRLASCVFPFQCAHGRPSMVPLLDFGQAQTEDADLGGRDVGFMEAFKQWQDNGVSDS